MPAENSSGSILCVSNGSIYQMRSEQNELVLTCVGQMEDGKSTYYEAPKREIALDKSELTMACEIRAKSTQFQLIRKGKTRTFRMAEPMTRESLKAFFDGIPCEIRVKGERAGKASFGVVMAVLCAATALLRAVLRTFGVPTLFTGVLTLIWIVIPPICLYRHLKRDLPLHKNDPDWIAAGLSCLLLLISNPMPDSFLGVLLPSALIALLMGGVAFAATKRIGTVTLLVVLASALIYAPGVTLCMDALHTKTISRGAVEILETSNTYASGDWRYTVTVDQDGITARYEVTRDEYLLATEGADAFIEVKSGLFGLKTTDVVLELRSSQTSGYEETAALQVDQYP